MQGFVSAQVLQRALTAAPRRSNVHSGTLTHNPKHQQQPGPSSSSNPFIGQYYVTFSCHSLPFRVHFLCRCTSSSHSPTSSSSFHTLPQVTPPPPSSLSLPPPFCPYSHEDRKNGPSGLRCTRKGHYSSELRCSRKAHYSTITFTNPFLREKLKNMSEALSLNI